MLVLIRSLDTVSSSKNTKMDGNQLHSPLICWLYGQIEKEALACTWVTEKFADYLLGMSFIIDTDHQPLIL